MGSDSYGGGQIRYARISPGTGYSDGVFEDQATPGKFLGSRITWNWWHGNWTVALKDGTQFVVQGCSGNSKPGQCAVTEIKNKKGERLKVNRDGDGNIVRITSPNGHFVSVTNDSAGRITRVDDDAKHWVSYQYDSVGALVKSSNWRGDDGCARNLWGARATGSGARTHRAIESVTSVRCCARNRSNEK